MAGRLSSKGRGTAEWRGCYALSWQSAALVFSLTLAHTPACYCCSLSCPQYCYGNGTCDHPGVPKGDISSALFMEDSASNPQLLLSQIAAAAPFVEKAMQTRIDKSKSSDEGDSRIAILARRIGSEEMKSNDRFARHRLSREGTAHAGGHDAAVAESDSADHHKKRSCHSCLRHGVRWVLKQSIKVLKAVCKETKCPHFQKFCAWAKEHKEVVRGMLYAHVQPWKAASGYCAGNGSCHCSKRTTEEQTAKEQSPDGAPFNMGEKDKNETEEKEEKKVEPVAPAKPVVIGRGKHDRMRHGKILH